ncbi:beta-glucuronidase [Lingula anatina]|uniref:Beta-glucuronidase n=1 Tax=Lingula anatina TaxID=7574 RepID=A0A1S3K9J1_LINAN|nr:beta-glucuronidase [Lingula anatina]|eukprot:XP_013419298.1 beta-glucuronidase [Lingula anatina]
MVLLGTIKMFIVPCYFCSILLLNIYGVHGILYPRESESRQIQDLNGIWDFRMDDSTNRNKGFEEDWFKQPLKRTGSVLKMPVPSSFNDITETREMRDFVGWVWYDRQFYVSPDWIKKRVVLRVDSAHYTAVVWVNSIEVVKHTGGHLPFEREVGEHLKFSGANRVTIAINNTLTPETLPPGEIVWHTDSSSYPIGYFTQKTQTNAFNYAGLHRSVRLYTTPVDYVDDITITTSFYHSKGHVKYNISRKRNATNSALTVEILDNDGNTVARAQADEKDGGELDIENVNLWWPYLMVDGGGPAYLYTLKVSFNTSQSTDVYRLPFGVRTVEVNGSQLFINKKPFYCRGVAKQEDADIRGRGLDLAVIVKDFNLLKWLGANCFRTSHYPYAEEIMDQADQQGIVVIDECPGMGLRSINFRPATKAHHLRVMTELVQRDKNRPSVIMWSVASDPESDLPQAENYFRSIISHTRHLDSGRPITFASNKQEHNDRLAQYVDVICLNRYVGWSRDQGHLDVIVLKMTKDLTNWYNKYKKPIIVTEYGAGAIPGLHKAPSAMFTEQYQVDLIKEYHDAFDRMRRLPIPFLMGEMVWNFADFQSTSDSGLDRNNMGVLTRQREPKAAAYALKARYYHLMEECALISKN